MYVKDDEWGVKYPHFKKEEFMCPCCNSVGKGIATSLVEDLEILRNKYGAIQITSGYRCPSYNNLVGGVSNSAHLRGQASDIYIMSGITNDQNKRINIVNEIKTLPNYHYAYCNVNGDYPNMGNAIHLDTYITDEPIEEKPKEETPKEEPKEETPKEEPKENTSEKESLIKQLLRKLIELLSRIMGDK